jgi:hypothetical protein
MIRCMLPGKAIISKPSFILLVSSISLPSITSRRLVLLKIPLDASSGRQFVEIHRSSKNSVPSSIGIESNQLFSIVMADASWPTKLGRTCTWRTSSKTVNLNLTRRRISLSRWISSSWTSKRILCDRNLNEMIVDELDN